MKIESTIDSVMNPSGGVIRAEGINELIMDETKIDFEKTLIITGEVKYAV